MTVEEKRKRLHEYCNDQGLSCCNCLLKERYEKFDGCYTDVSDEIVNENYEIVFGDEKPDFLEKELNIPSNDPVNRPSHYTDGKIEVIDFIEDKKLGFCLGNAIKYIARAGKKDPTKEREDIKKAIWYLNRYLKELEEV